MSLEDENSRVVARAYAQLRRETVRKTLSPMFIQGFDLLCDILSASKDGDYFAPYTGYRSLEEQQAVYDMGRVDKSKPIVTYAVPGNSAHNWGCATDWAEYRPEFVGQEIWNKANWTFFANCVAQAGLHWGGNFPTPDRPHAQLHLDVSWKMVGDVYRAHGKEAAIEFIRDKIHKPEGK